MLDWIKELPDTSTPLNKEFFQKLANSILDNAFPIGKTEIFYDNDDHSNYLGFNWERTAVGKAIVGIDGSDADFNTIGKIGGEKVHTLILGELPKHYPEIYIKDFVNMNNGTTTAAYSAAINNSGISYNYETGVANTFANRMGATIGNNQAHNNLQPYQVFAIWKRVE